MDEQFSLPGRLHDAIDRGDFKEAHRLADEMKPKEPETKKPDEKPEEVDYGLRVVSAIMVALLVALIGVTCFGISGCVKDNQAVEDYMNKLNENSAISDKDFFEDLDGRKFIGCYDDRCVLYVSCKEKAHDCWNYPGGDPGAHFYRLESDLYNATKRALHSQDPRGDHQRIDVVAILKVRQELREIKEKLNKDRPEY